MLDLRSQQDALKALADFTAKSIVEDPIVRTTALKITSECSSRDDLCEIEAIFNAVKSGTPLVKSLSKGMRYVADPRLADYFTRPGRSLQLCDIGACGGDCDDQAALVAALLGAIGFEVGLRAYALPSDKSVFVHVYPVVGFPKRKPEEYLGLDTTVPQSYVGWEPPKSRVLTAIIK